MKSLMMVADKAANIRGAFQVNAERLAGNEIILIDDIYQTGTTINEVTRALRAAGVQRVFGLTLTKTIRSL